MLKLFIVAGTGGRFSWHLIAAITGVDAIKWAKELDPQLAKESTRIEIVGVAHENVTAGPIRSFFKNLE